jgi:8-oxo-dGTP diphosphatase
MDGFTTERLVARPYEERDREALVDLHARPELARSLGASAGVHDADGAGARPAPLVERPAHRASPPYGHWVVTERGGRVVGAATLTPDASCPTGDVALAWHLHPDVRGRGYATELARALVERGFGGTDCERLVAVVDPADERSAAVARRAGLAFSGTRDRHLRVYAIDRTTWTRRALRRAWSVAIFARHEGRVLLVKHKRLGTWLPVGGEVEAGETPLEAARRELLEETGLEGIFPPTDPLEGAPPGLLGYEEHLAGKKGLHLNVSFVADVATSAVVLDESLAGHVWASLEVGPWDEAPANVRQLAARALSAPPSCP